VSIYKEFAKVYASGDYPQFSKHMANILPPLLNSLNAKPKSLLDVACGEGAFAIAMAQKGFAVTGIDLSSEMLTIAKMQEKQISQKVLFQKMDMRKLRLSSSFDLITCWFDSLNYLLTNKDLEVTFKGIYNHLNTGGYFIFDMNTIYWLQTLADRYAVTIEKETNDVFQVHRHTFDEETKIATFHLIAFLKENSHWIRRVNETHFERGYTLDEIRLSLNKAGLTEIACYGNLEERLPFAKESKRIWFITKK
jgi:SAM-dependent methyltransferase